MIPMIPPLDGNISYPRSEFLTDGFPAGVQTICSFSKFLDYDIPDASKIKRRIVNQNTLQGFLATIMAHPPKKS
jgi:hypothetical protein